MLLNVESSLPQKKKITCSEEKNKVQVNNLGAIIILLKLLLKILLYF